MKCNKLNLFTGICLSGLILISTTTPAFASEVNADADISFCTLLRQRKKNIQRASK